MFYRYVHYLLLFPFILCSFKFDIADLSTQCINNLPGKITAPGSLEWAVSPSSPTSQHDPPLSIGSWHSNQRRFYGYLHLPPQQTAPLTGLWATIRGTNPRRPVYWETCLLHDCVYWVPVNQALYRLLKWFRLSFTWSSRTYINNSTTHPFVKRHECILQVWHIICVILRGSLLCDSCIGCCGWRVSSYVCVV